MPVFKRRKTKPEAYAYVRVSTMEQNEDRQMDAMKAVGIRESHIYLEKKSGKDFDRPEYRKLVKMMKEGDVLYILSIDRLGRNYDEIREQWRLLTKIKKVNIVVLDMPLLDTRQYKDLVGTLISDLVLELLAYVAESERASISERTRQGLKAAKKRGARLGRPRLHFNNDFVEMYRAVCNGKLSISKAAAKLGICKSTFRYRIKAYNERHKG